MRKIKNTLAALALTLVAGVGTANAAIQTNLDSVTPVVGGYLWTYSIKITGLEEIRSNDFFTIYDFAGYIPNTITAPTNWTGTVQNFGIAGPNQDTAVDDPRIPNLIFTYIGDADPNLYVNLKNADVVGLTFSAKSIYGSEKDGWSSSQTTSLRSGNRKNGSTDDAVVPTAVPLPAASWMGLGLLAGLGAFRAVRRSRMA